MEGDTGAVIIESPESSFVSQRQVAIMQNVIGMLYKAGLDYPTRITTKDLSNIITRYIIEEYRILHQQVQGLSANQQDLTD